MTLRTTLFALGLLTFSATPSSAAETQRVLVQMKAPPAAGVLTSANRRDTARALQRRAALAQAPLLDQVKGFAPTGRPLQSFWIANAVALDATPAQIEALRARPDVLSVETNAKVLLDPVTRSEAPPADDIVSTWGLKRMRVLEAQQAYGVDGTGVVVGILDTGFDANHPALAGRLLAYKNFTGDYQEPADGHGHGSHCAGTIGGGPLGSMQIGVAPGVRFVAGKIFPDQGAATTEGILAAMQWVVDPDGVPDSGDEPRLVSNSWGGGPGRKVYQQAVQNWLALGIAPIFAAGNSGPRASTVGSPADYLESFAVGATTAEAAVAKFSSRGPVRWDGVEHIKPDVSAPGKAVTSVKSGGGSWTISGTSMATPHVAGLAALLYQARPDLSPEEVLEAIQSTALDHGSAGKDNDWGQGEVDAPAALAAIFEGGVVTGRVLANDGEAIAYATLRVPGEARSIRLAADGSYRIFRPEGAVTLLAEAFGYAPVEVPVSVSASEDSSQDFSLEQLPHGALAGTVTAEGAPVAAQVYVLGTPLAAILADENGHFEVPLPAGSYVLQAQAHGFEVATSEEVAVTADAISGVELSLETLPPVLVVADDGTKSYGEIIQDALTLPSKRLDREALKSLDSTFLTQYQAVVWLTGDERRDVLTEADQTSLKGYLEAGGRVLLTGQDLATSLRMSRFLRFTLKTNVLGNTDRSFSVKGAGAPLSLKGGDGAKNQRSPDMLQARPGGEELLAYGSGKTAAVLSRPGRGRAALLGFGIEGVASAAGRRRLVKAVFGKLGIRSE